MLQVYKRIMDKCRICMKLRKRMHSLYDSMEKDKSNLDSCITYAVMVASISNVKISKHDGLPDEICIGCCKRLKDIYDFRCLIERSDIELQKTSQYKRIMFTDLKDMKGKIEIEENDSKDAMLQNNNITEQFVRSTEKSLNYNSTIIQRLCLDTNDKKSLSVKEFLESIKEDPENEYDIVYDVAVDYDPESDKEDYTSNQSSESEEDGITIKKIDLESTDEDYTPSKTKYKKKKKITKGEQVVQTDYRQIDETAKIIKIVKIVENIGVDGNNSIMSCDKTNNTMSIKPVFLSDVRVARTKLPNKQKRNRQRKNQPRDLKGMCPYCGKMFKVLKVHLATHVDERNYKCSICSKSYKSKPVLNIHMKTHSSKELKCDKCDAFYKCPYRLKRHIVERHLGDVAKIPCEICGKSFRSKSHLSRHCLGVHNIGTKKYNCEQCSMSFVTRSSLNNHMRIHTRERPYKCELCSQPYSYKRDFDRHCLKKHGVFIKSRQVSVMNEHTLIQERAVMRDMMLRVNGVLKDDKPINPFKGPHADVTFEQAIKALKSNQITIDL